MTAGFEHKYDLGDVVEISGDVVQIFVIEIGPPLTEKMESTHTVQYGGYIVSQGVVTTSFRWFWEHSVTPAVVGG